MTTPKSGIPDVERIATLEREAANRTDLLELAWGIIANAGGGDWTKESKEWQDAAIKWRDTYFGSLSKVSKQSSEQPNVHVPPYRKCPTCGFATIYAKEGE